MLTASNITGEFSEQMKSLDGIFICWILGVLTGCMLLGFAWFGFAPVIPITACLMLEFSYFSGYYKGISDCSGKVAAYKHELVMRELKAAIKILQGCIK